MSETRRWTLDRLIDLVGQPRSLQRMELTKLAAYIESREDALNEALAAMDVIASPRTHNGAERELTAVKKHADQTAQRIRQQLSPEDSA